VGLCHCLTCRKETGSVGNFFAIWPSDRVAIAGKTRSWKAKTDDRRFCPTCGSSVFAVAQGATEIEIRAGAFDEAPTDLSPADELWIGRREAWLPPVANAEQYIGNRT
jgi:hypothetical protein